MIPRPLSRFATFLPTAALSLALAVAPVTLAAPLAAQGQNGHFDCESFEGHRYTLGNLAGIDMFSGQDHWMLFDSIALNPNLAAARVQDTRVRSGRQAVVLDAALLAPGTFGELRRNAFFALSTGVIEHEMDFWIESSTTPSEWEFYTQVAPHPASCQARWWIGTNGQVQYLTTPARNHVVTSFVVAKDMWHHARTVVDITADVVQVWIDGTLVFSGVPISSIVAPGHGFSQVNCYGAGNDKLFVDNWRVRERTAEHGLNADPKRLPINQRTVVTFRLNGGPAMANRTYALVGSLSGTTPGQPIGSITLPLVVDGFFWLIVGQLGSPGLPGFLGTCGNDGWSEAVLDTQVPVPAALLGLQLDFAYLSMSPIDEVSEPVRVNVTTN